MSSRVASVVERRRGNAIVASPIAASASCESGRSRGVGANASGTLTRASKASSSTNTVRVAVVTFRSASKRSRARSAPGPAATTLVTAPACARRVAATSTAATAPAIARRGRARGIDDARRLLAQGACGERGPERGLDLDEHPALRGALSRHARGRRRAHRPAARSASSLRTRAERDRDARPGELTERGLDGFGDRRARSRRAGGVLRSRRPRG